MTTGTTNTGRALLLLSLLTLTPALQGCSHVLMMARGTGATRPAASEFGPGPRSSAGGRYVATLEPAAPFRPRRMQTVQVVVRGAAGEAIDDAQIAIDGGMPQHGHGLPTRPRVTRALGDGRYEIEGVRFNMGGWWTFTLAITSARGTDTVTFNLAL
jgi:YtkA-like